MRKTTNVLYALSSFCSEADGTYDLSTHQPVEFHSGYQVSFVRPEATDLTGEEWDALTEYCCDYLLSCVYIGVYCGDVEVSFHTDNIDKAKYIMEQFNQESILYWGAKVAYPDDCERWFLFNPFFDANKVVNYNEILGQI